MKLIGEGLVISDNNGNLYKWKNVNEPQGTTPDLLKELKNKLCMNNE